jgi:hypothetical protein
MSGAILAAWLAVCGGDAATTHVALRGGAVEVNLSQRPWITDALVAGEAGAVAGALHSLRRTHPRVARGMAIAAIAWRGAVVAHNVRVLHEIGRGPR